MALDLKIIKSMMWYNKSGMNISYFLSGKKQTYTQVPVTRGDIKQSVDALHMYLDIPTTYQCWTEDNFGTMLLPPGYGWS